MQCGCMGRAHGPQMFYYLDYYKGPQTELLHNGERRCVNHPECKGVYAKAG